MHLTWSPQAKRDLDRFFEFLLDKNPSAALEVLELIEAGAETLCDHPKIGTAFNDGTDRRVWRIAYGKSVYQIHYIANHQKDAIQILKLWHNKELQ